MAWFIKGREERRIIEQYRKFAGDFEAAMDAQRKAILPSDIKAAEDAINKSFRLLRIRYIMRPSRNME